MALSYKDIQALLEIALGDPPARGYISIRDVWPDKFVYTVNDYDRSDTPTYERAYSIDLDGKVTLGEAKQVRQVTSYEVVTFSGIEVDLASFSGSGAPDAKLFKLGEYPDMGFALSPIEADAAVAAFSPFPVMLEHGRTALGETEFGMVRSMRREGEWLVGSVDVAPNVRTALKGSKPKLSMSWHRATKRPKECSIVDVPRIAEAGLVAAFSGVPIAEPAPTRTGPLMSLIDKIKSALGLNDTEAAELNANFSASDRVATLETENQALKDRLSAVETGGASPANFGITIAKREAERIIGELRAADKLSPAESDKVLASFTSAISTGAVEFSAVGDYKETDLVKGIREAYEARPPLRLREKIANSYTPSAEFSARAAEFKDEKPKTPQEQAAIFNNVGGGK